jgi:diguanylate cyclase (GGDEF)-like protein
VSRLLRHRVLPVMAFRVFTVFICLSIIGLYGWLAWSSSGTVDRGARRDTANLAEVLSRQNASTIKTVDVVLQGLQYLADDGGSAASRQNVLPRLAAVYVKSTPELYAITVVGPTGTPILSTNKAMKRSATFRGRPYFQFHVTHRTRGLLIGAPFVGIVDGSWLIPLSRRFDRNGAFGGVVIATVSLSNFESIYRRVDVGTGGTISLVLDDGTVLARKPFDRRYIGQNVKSGALFRHYRHATSGAFIAHSSLDGVERLTAYRHFDGFPMLLQVALPVDAIYAPWRTAILLGLIGVVVLLGTIVLLARISFREMRHRELAEMKLRSYAFQDGLTQLANRRSFDAVLTREWARALRDRTSLALLMIDADNFKAYNDRYGHQMGDDVLKAVARCITGSVERPNDLAARYGGEEFAVILPATSPAGARMIAEKIRVAVVSLRIPHLDTAAQVVSISIGFAAFVPTDAGNERSLIGSADAALYDAKHNGRNRVESARVSISVGLPPTGN